MPKLSAFAGVSPEYRIASCNDLGVASGVATVLVVVLGRDEVDDRRRDS